MLLYEPRLELGEMSRQFDPSHCPAEFQAVQGSC